MQKDCLHKHDINLKFDTNEQIIHKKQIDINLSIKSIKEEIIELIN